MKQQILSEYPTSRYAEIVKNPSVEITDEANPNGSLHSIAGITNKNKNVFGMMPHPERAADEHLGNKDGLAMFESILNHCS